MRASTAGPQPSPPVDLSDREHYRAHLNSMEDRLFISRPVIGRVSGKWSVQLSRRFLNLDGTFGGVIVVSLDPEHFTKFFNRVDLASSGSIALIGKWFDQMVASVAPPRLTMLARVKTARIRSGRVSGV